MNWTVYLEYNTINLFSNKIESYNHGRQIKDIMLEGVYLIESNIAI